MCAIMGFSTKKLDKHEIWEYFDRTLSRGPDMSRLMDTGSGWLCFHRLAIMASTGFKQLIFIYIAFRPLSWTATWWSATASCTASAP